MTRPRRPSPQMIAVLFMLADRASEPIHGYDLCQALDLRAGTMYPLLRRLDERGLVDTRWEEHPPQGRPARHLYRLSAAGADLVAQLRARDDEASPARAAARRTAAPAAPVRQALGSTP